MCRGVVAVSCASRISHDVNRNQKAKFTFIKIVLAQILFITFLASVISFRSDWQRFRQGPLMAKFRIKKIFIDNVSFKNVW